MAILSDPTSLRQTVAGVVPIVGMDPRAVKVLDDFIAVAGGPSAIRTYDAVGVMRVAIGSQTARVRYHTFWTDPDKFVAVVDSDVMGEIREIHNGKNVFMESNTGFSDTIPVAAAEHSRHYFAPLFDVLTPGYFKAMKFEGQYESDGKMVQVISALSAKGESIAMTFDPAAKTLVRIATTGTGTTVEFDDYRKVGELLLPYKLSMGGMFNFELRTLIVNEKIDPSAFEKKQNCFDKP